MRGNMERTKAEAVIEAVLFAGLTAYNFKPLLISVKRLLKKGDKKQ